MTREELERTQGAKLLELLRQVFLTNPFYRRKLEAAGCDPAALEEGPALDETLDRLPFTTKAEIEEDQARHPPYGTNLTYPIERYVRLHQTSGTSGVPLRWLDTRESWEWLLRSWEEIYSGIGLTRSDRLFFPFSFGPFIGFWAAFEGACRLGNLSLSGGGMTTAARLRFLLENRATVIGCTPTYALRMAEVAAAEGVDLRASSVRALVVAGEPGGSLPGTRERIEAAWDARCFDHCGMTEAGSFGFECVESPGGMHVLESEFIAEVVEPETGRRLAEGRDGELVITNLGRLGSPAIRYRTGDVVRWTTAACPCGRPYGRLDGGVLGRLDDMLIVRGNNFYPAAIESLLRGFPEVAEYQVRVRQAGEMTSLEVSVEATREADGQAESPRVGKSLAARVAAAIEERLLFRAEVRAVPAGTLPRYELKARRFIKEVL